MSLKPRNAATALLLGLPVALLAHALVFGQSHAVGGAMHGAALSGCAFALAVAVALSSRDAAQGSILASRLRACAPRVPLMLFSGAAWFAALESCERAHGIPLAAVAVAMVAASLLIRLAISLLARSLAAVALALLAHGEHLHSLERACLLPRHRSPHALKSFPHTRRLYSRPPPILS